MDLNYFKDKVFDLLNEADGIGIRDIETHDKENTFIIFSEDGNLFELKFRQVS